MMTLMRHQTGTHVVIDPDRGLAIDIATTAAAGMLPPIIAIVMHVIEAIQEMGRSLEIRPHRPRKRM